jgi:2-dehydropantoate 2-reductase
LIGHRPIEADQILGDLLVRAGVASLSTPLLAAAYTHLCVYQRRLVSAQSRSSD